MIVDHRIVGLQLDGPLQLLDRGREVAELEIGPTQAIDIVAVVGLQLHRLADVVHAGLQIVALIDPGVAEIVEHEGFVGRQLERALQIGLGARPVVQPLVTHAAGIIERPILLARFRKQRDGAGVIVARLAVALMRAQDVAERIERADVLRILGDELLEQPLGVVDPIERVQSKGLLDLHVQPKRGGFRDLVEGIHLQVVLLGALIGLGERYMGDGKVGLQVEGELQEDDAHIEPAFAGKRIANAVEHLGQPFTRSGDEERRHLAAFDLTQQRLAQRMALRLGDVGLQRLERELAVIVVHRVAGIGLGHPERAGILLEGLGKGRPRHVVLAGEVGDEAAMIALIELRPVGVA